MREDDAAGDAAAAVVLSAGDACTLAPGRPFTLSLASAAARVLQVSIPSL